MRSDLPRFFFDFDEGDHRIPDPDGTEFQDAESACEEAAAALANIAADATPSPHSPTELAVLVRDEAGQPIYRATLTIRGERIGA